MLQLEPPQVALARGADERGAHAHIGAARRGVARIEDDETGVLHPAVRIFEAEFRHVAQRRAGGVAVEAQRARRRQAAAAADMVVEKQACTQHPGRPQAGPVRQHETQRPDDVRRRRPQRLALFERVAHQPEGVVFEIAQAAVDQLGRGGGGRRGEVAFLDQQRLQPAPGGVAGDADAIDAAADHRDVERLRHGDRPTDMRRAASSVCATSTKPRPPAPGVT